MNCRVTAQEDATNPTYLAEVIPQKTGGYMTDNSMMDYPVCGEQIKKTALKCRHCGENIAEFKEKQEASVEKEIFSGSPATFYSYGQVVMILFLFVASIFIIGIPFLIIYLFYYWLGSKNTRYTITTHRLVVEKGILSKSKDSMELYRIQDFEIKRPLLMRMKGYGYLNIITSDKTTPEINIYGIKNIEDIAEKIRNASNAERKRHGVTVREYEPA
jgi:membrane protein YdbS with pleckstrin-like domain